MHLFDFTHLWRKSTSPFRASDLFRFIVSLYAFDFIYIFENQKFLYFSGTSPFNTPFESDVVQNKYSF